MDSSKQSGTLDDLNREHILRTLPPDARRYYGSERGSPGTVRNSHFAAAGSTATHRPSWQWTEAALCVRFDERLWQRTRIARDVHDTLLQTITVSSERAL